MQEEIKVKKPKKKRKAIKGASVNGRNVDYRETEILNLIDSLQGYHAKKVELIKARCLLFQYYIITNNEKMIMSYGKELKEWLEKNIQQAKTDNTKRALYEGWNECMKYYARYDFGTFNEYIEFLMPEEKQFYNQRKRNKAFEKIVTELNEAIMGKPKEKSLKLQGIAISMPPRTGKSQIGIRFLAWVCGKFPESSNLGISCTNTVTSSFYSGIMEIVRDDERYRYNDVFPEATLCDQDAKDNLIWLGKKKRYQTIAFKSIGAGVQGAFEAEKVIYCDDLVEGYETAISIDRLDKLWEIYLSNIVNRKKEGCVEIHIGTRWSIHDVIGRLEQLYGGNPTWKFIKFPALNDDDCSNFMYEGGFSTNEYRKIRERYTTQNLEHIWKAVYQNEPIEKDGTVFTSDTLNYFYNLPEGLPDAKICVIDSKNQGKDYVACAILYNYEPYWYLADVVFSNGLPTETTKLIADKIVEHKVPVVYCESNNGGEYFAGKVDELVQQRGFYTSVGTFFTSSNKVTRIITQAPFIQEYFLFKARGTYVRNTPYDRFMENVFEFNQKGTAKHDKLACCRA